MRAVIQRVSRAEITIDHQETREIGQGLVVFLGVMKGDTEAQAEFLAEKAQGLRIFTDENGKMNLSLEDIGGEMLVVSNFTLGTDCKKGRRPSFDMAAPPAEADRLDRHFVERARGLGHPQQPGIGGVPRRLAGVRRGQQAAPGAVARGHLHAAGL